MDGANFNSISTFYSLNQLCSLHIIQRIDISTGLNFIKKGKLSHEEFKIILTSIHVGLSNYLVPTLSPSKR